jgi:hypothetical protein
MLPDLIVQGWTGSRNGGSTEDEMSVAAHRRRLCRGLGASFVLLGVALLFVNGCGEPQAVPTEPRPVERVGVDRAPATVQRPPTAVAPGFAPVRVHVLPLTELAQSTGGSSAVLSVYLSLLDEFGSSIKAPVILRFELYEYVPRSADPKGQRIAIWSDIDLTDAGRNHAHWHDFLRTYEFKLDVQADVDETYILEATCMCLEGKRLSAEFTLKPGI